jgi:hypothetical protein
LHEKAAGEALHVKIPSVNKMTFRALSIFNFVTSLTDMLDNRKRHSPKEMKEGGEAEEIIAIGSRWVNFVAGRDGPCPILPSEKGISDGKHLTEEENVTSH